MPISAPPRTIAHALTLAVTAFALAVGTAAGAGPQGPPVAARTEPGAANAGAAPRGRDGFWIAEVAWPTVNVHAKPNAAGEVRRGASEGDLLRVTGIAPGIDGDEGTWWSTTEGYVPDRSIRPAGGEWADSWRMPEPSEAPHGFWVEVTSPASVRAGPTLNAPAVGTLEPGARVKVLAEEADRDDGDPAPWYRIDGGRYAGARLYSGRTSRLPDPQPNTAAPAEGATGRWIVVDRAATTLTVVRDGQPEFATYVSLGRAGVETPSGLYRISNKLEFDDMRSDRNPTADRSYYLPGVPHVQYFSEGGDAIHGTYWHDQFGTQESQGCINLTLADGGYVFGLTGPPGAGGAATALVILD